MLPQGLSTPCVVVSMKKISFAVLLAATGLSVAPGLASAAGVDYADGVWSEASITEPDGTVLHADVLRPEGLTDADKTPVIISIGPYFNHSGQTGPAGPVENAAYDPVGPNAGPSERFQDFVEGAKLFTREKKYTFVMVDLRGFGGSTGCLDWGGPGEQSDVVEAVKWAATQKWSTGAVGTYGKSYDGMTGLMGAAARPDALKAVVAQEPVYDNYRYLYGDGIRRENALATPGLYDAIAATPGPLADTDQPDVQRQRQPARRPAPGLLRGQLRRPADDDHYVRLLEDAQHHRERQGLERPGVHHPGHDGEQHRARRRRRVPDQPHRPRARLARSLEPRPRRRDGRQQARHGPRRLVRRGHAVVRQVPLRRRAGRARTRRSPSRA